MMIIIVRIMITWHHLSFLRLWLHSDEMHLKSRDLGCELGKRVQQLLLGVPIKPDDHNHHNNHDNDDNDIDDDVEVQRSRL